MNIIAFKNSGHINPTAKKASPILFQSGKGAQNPSTTESIDQLILSEAARHRKDLQAAGAEFRHQLLETLIPQLSKLREKQESWQGFLPLLEQIKEAPNNARKKVVLEEIANLIKLAPHIVRTSSIPALQKKVIDAVTQGLKEQEAFINHHEQEIQLIHEINAKQSKKASKKRTKGDRQTEETPVLSTNFLNPSSSSQTVAIPQEHRSYKSPAITSPSWADEEFDPGDNQFP